MAKKSARSKGYRKYYKKKETELTPKQKKWLLWGSLAAIIIILLIVFVPRIVESTKLLKVKDGVVQMNGNHWLITNQGTRSKPKYHKLAEVDGAATGFEETDSSSGIDTNIVAYLYNGSDEAHADMQYSVQTASSNAQEGAENYISRIVMLGEPTQSGEVQPTTACGRDAWQVVGIYAPTDMGDGVERPAFTQTGVLYVESTFPDISVVLNVTKDLQSEEDALSEEEMFAL
ncbi:MAG: hypothetical protein IJ234_03960, partial [Clostridia bacterium]|nr:hypothetical protein [Clostridia bacterium]